MARVKGCIRPSDTTTNPRCDRELGEQGEALPLATPPIADYVAADEAMHAQKTS